MSGSDLGRSGLRAARLIWAAHQEFGERASITDRELPQKRSDPLQELKVDAYLPVSPGPTNPSLAWTT